MNIAGTKINAAVCSKGEKMQMSPLTMQLSRCVKLICFVLEVRRYPSIFENT